MGAVPTLTLRSLRARWIRFLLTSTAVILGVAFVVGSFVLADTLRKVFDSLAITVTQDIDVQVRAVDPLASGVGSGGTTDPGAGDRPPVPAELVTRLAAVDGVARARGDLSAFVSVATTDGRLVDPGGAPVVGIGWLGPDPTVDQALSIVEGRAPSGEGEVALDSASAADYGLRIGDTVTVRGVGASRTMQIVGTITLGSGSGGAYYAVTDQPTAQKLFGLGDQFQSVTLNAVPGVTQTELRDRVAGLLAGEPYEVVTGKQAGEEISESFGRFIDIFRTALLVFAFVTLFVAGFLINTVFTTTVGQRVRELALLRALGARNGQVTVSVLAESLAIGLLAWGVGTVAGIGVAELIKRLFISQGGGFPDRPLVLAGSTWVVSFVIGVGITLAVSLLPAWRAGQVPPIAGMRASWSPAPTRIRRRVVVGSLVVVVGAVVFLGGLFADPGSTAARLGALGAGALLIFVGVTALSPLAARPAARLIGWPLERVFRATGRLARGNAARNPRRTASTAAALMIGVALVSMVGVVGASFKASVADQLDRGITADWFLSSKAFYGFSPDVATELAAVDGVEHVATFRTGQVRVGEDTKTVSGVQSVGLDRIVNLGVEDGDVTTLPDDGLLLHRSSADDLGVGVGDVVDVQFPLGGVRPLRVVAIFGSSIGGLSNWIVNQDVFGAGFPSESQFDVFGGLALAADADPTATAAAIRAVVERYPEVDLQDRSAFKANQEGQIDSLLVIVNALLVFSLVIAVLGIAITLALAVFERTRELGLLRAVGQRKGQTRTMVVLEAVVVALFGAGSGIVLGVLFGVAIATALPRDVVSIVTLSWSQLVGTLVVAAIAGVFAAVLPAWRAGRLRVLDAIAYE